MRKLSLIGALLLCAGSILAQGKTDMWESFAKTKFEPKYYEKLGEYLFYPTFPADIKALERDYRAGILRSFRSRGW
jgi:hypothetical protein